MTHGRKSGRGRVKVGEKLTVHVHSTYLGQPIVFEVEGTVVKENERLFIRLINGMQAPLSEAEISGPRKPAKGAKP